MKKKDCKKKKNKFIKIVLVLVMFIALIKVIPSIILLNINDDNMNKELSNNGKKALENKENFNFEVNNSDLKYVIENKKLLVKVEANNLKNDSIYTIVYGVENNLVEEDFSNDKTVELELAKEGENNCYIAIKKDGNIIKESEWNDTYYYINPYKKQFLDELEHKGVGVHVFEIPESNMSKFLPIYKALGSQYARTDVKMRLIYSKDNTIINGYQNRLENLMDSGIKILAILGAPGERGGSDGLISDEEELEGFGGYAYALSEYYPQMLDYEIWNEPNAFYKTEEQMQWYAKTVAKSSEMLKKQNSNNKILSGAISYGPKVVKSVDFINKISEYSGYKSTDSFSYHIYDFLNRGYLNTDYEYKMNENKNTVNNLGGFMKNSNTEYGLSTYAGLFSEYDQAIKVVQQSVLGDYYNMYISTVYDFINLGTDANEKEDNFGLITLDAYRPKKAYYSQKTYFENINGAEYIGKITLADDLEFHVYDKDGKPKVVAWSCNTNNTINMEYDGFIAKDMYGNVIENTDGILKITSAPVYLDNISTNCFYKAISEMSISKINEFEEKYSNEISKINGLLEALETKKTNMQNISELNSVTEEYSKTEMESLFNLGNSIIQNYKAGNLDIEYVKLSSMLDSLNDIGNYYEDLVTVSAISRNINLVQTNQKIQETENSIYADEDLDIIYPNKILKFSKDLYDKAKYINELEEENPIKTGLIVSKNMHSDYLASWAKEFANLYIDKYISENPVTIEYSETSLTNRDVKARIVTNANIQITNNSGSNEYVFKENGEFEFEYNIRNKQFTAKATVNNIDKLEPTISGVIREKTYTIPITPVITDENLDKIELKVNGTINPEYTNKTTLSEEGIYQLMAKDKAGNINIVTFQIIENIGEDYKIKNNIVTNIMTDTKLKEFKSKANINTRYTVMRNGISLNDNDNIATGDIIKTDSQDEYRLIVAGDINKDGKTTIKDVVRLTRYLLGDIELNDIEKLAADANCDGKELGIRDVVRLKIYALERVED